MDIFDLKIDEFEKKIDEFLESLSSEELLEELVNNGLVIDEYDNTSYYMEEDTNNVWVHKTRTSNTKRKKKIFFKRNKEINLLEAA